MLLHVAAGNHEGLRQDACPAKQSHQKLGPIVARGQVDNPPKELARTHVRARGPSPPGIHARLCVNRSHRVGGRGVSGARQHP
eukprot:10587376-Alexandrium_andersonii.AAC.1